MVQAYKLTKEIEKQIRKDFEFLKEKSEVEAVLVYGSWAKGEATTKSDIDICIVAPRLKTPKEFASLLLEIWGRIDSNKYDVRIFEELPLYIKIDVIKTHKVIFCKKGIPELSYYFYKYRKIWQDQSLHWIDKKD